jgi:hypothetical protein
MPAVPIYSASPISGAKASGTTPQTAAPEDANKTSRQPATTTTTAVSSSSQAQQGYPAAQPGARPHMPAPTGAPLHAATATQPPPTRTIQDVNPPPPQPGAVPVPPNVAAHIPPPPRAGETLKEQQQQQYPAPTGTTSMPTPPQMSYPPPSHSQDPTRTGASTYTGAPTQTFTGSRPTNLPGLGAQVSYEHPPDYRQGTFASEMDSSQNAARDAWLARNDSYGADDGVGEGVWDTAKKWAAAAGESLAAAEGEVWKRINKD